MNHRWQSESTDGRKGGWSCVFWSGCNVVAVVTSPQLLDIVWCGAVVVVGVVVGVVVVVV